MTIKKTFYDLPVNCIIMPLLCMTQCDRSNDRDFLPSACCKHSRGR